jgi:sterol desaturase/sphingolipid hydroxylase (fatty acid hydroxylase superfamily)
MIDERTFQVARGAALALAFGIALALERRRPHTPGPARRRENLYLWGVNMMVIGLVCGSCLCTAARWAAGAGVGVMNALAVSAWMAVPVTLVCLDLLSYAWHRANHRVAVLWRFHRVHHLDQAPNCSTAVRFHPGELLLSLPLRLGAVLVLGAPVEAVVAFEIVFAWSNVLEHGNFDVARRLERGLARVLITPAMHRLHHSSDRDELDTNFGTVFALWDRLFGTYRPSTSALVFVAGVPGRVAAEPPPVFGLLVEPLRSAVR